MRSVGVEACRDAFQTRRKIENCVVDLCTDDELESEAVPKDFNRLLRLLVRSQAAYLKKLDFSK